MTSSRAERVSLAILLVIFTAFTWRGLTMFYSGDDMMNMFEAWDLRPWQLAQAQLLPWVPVYRPVGGAIYRLIYAAFGFHPEPLYAFCWLLLAANVLVAYRFFRTVTLTGWEALTALSLVLVHGAFNDLYYSAGTIYDRLCFLFTLTALITYLRFRRQPDRRTFALICLFAILAMGSKESGVTVLPLLVCAELLYIPGGRGIRQSGPLFATLTALSLVFYFGRMRRTPGLLTNPLYTPHPGPGAWLSHTASYLGILTYNKLLVTPLIAALLLIVMLAAALALKNRTMLFGWLFFVISITPVALITMRPGYVLYLPDLGLGLYFAACIKALIAPLARRVPQAPAIAFASLTLILTVTHVRNWPRPWDPHVSPEFRLTEQFRRDYPALPPHSKLLFARDEFPPDAFDLLFNLRLLYHDKSLLAYRLQASPDQKPDPARPPVYDHIFTTAVTSNRQPYAELDPRDPAESLRLNILKNASVGCEMEMARPDHSAYVVSGLKDGPGNEAGRWTGPNASLKFQVHPPATTFSTKFYVPPVAASPNRSLAIVLNGNVLTTVPLTRDGFQEISLPVPPQWLKAKPYTLLEMNVTNPYTTASGESFGVVLMRAGFPCRQGS